MSLDRFTELYLSYRNDFVSVEAFAAWYNLSLDTANSIITLGRAVSALHEAV